MKKVLFVLIAIVMLIGTFGCSNHKHTYINATCNKPGTCSECGVEGGNPLGHSTTLGYCSRCKEFQGTETFRKYAVCNMSILSAYSSSTQYMIDYGDTDKAYAMKFSKLYLSTFEDDLLELYDICYEESELISICGL